MGKAKTPLAAARRLVALAKEADQLGKQIQEYDFTTGNDVVFAAQTLHNTGSRIERKLDKKTRFLDDYYHEGH